MKLEDIQSQLDLLATPVEERGDVGISPRVFASACLPYRRPRPTDLINGNWVRRNGDYSLWISGGQDGIPYGSIPRLIYFFLATEAAKTKSPFINLGSSFSEFCSRLSLADNGGQFGQGSAARKQANRFFSSRYAFYYNNDDVDKASFMSVSDEFELSFRRKGDTYVVLTDRFFDAITRQPVLIDMGVIRALKQSPMALDIYSWLVYRYYNMGNKSSRPTWRQLEHQFGTACGRTRKFAELFQRALTQVHRYYPAARFEVQDKGLLLLPSPTPVPRLEVVK